MKVSITLLFFDFQPGSLGAMSYLKRLVSGNVLLSIFLTRLGSTLPLFLKTL